jgi:TRAP transporter TAXI family solute receptor
MNAKRLLWTILITALFLFSLTNISSAQDKKKQVIRWGSSQAGSSAYIVLFGVAKLVNDELPDIYIEAVPTGGSIASQRMMGKGELEGVYSGAWNFTDMYINRGPYEKAPFPADAPKPYQTWYCYLAKQYVITKAERNDIKTWRDLAGKTVFANVPGSSVYEVPRAAFTALGIWDKMKVVNIPFTSVADALKMGTIDAVVGYANGDVLIPWMAEVDTRVKLKIIPQTPDEFEVIKKVAGYSTPILDTKKVFAQDMGVPQVNAIADYYGFHIGNKLSTEDAYKVIKILVEKANEVAKIHGTLRAYAEDPLDMQVKAISTIPDIPVHPGVAKYLKEKGVWKNEFKIGN